MRVGQNSLAAHIAAGQHRYGYSTLPGPLQEAYHKLLDGYMRHKSSITVRVRSLDEAWSVHRMICYDVPEVFFIQTVQGAYDPRRSVATVYPRYRFDLGTCLNILEEMKAQTRAFTGRIAMLSEGEKVRQIHDWLVRRFTYRDLSAPYSHEAPGALLYGAAVCEGVAKAFKYLADRAGIQSVVVIGSAEDQNGGQTASGTGHAWNIAYVDGQPYHIDVTFDYSVSSGGHVRYDYFLLSDSQIQRDHTFEGTPPCGRDCEFYQLTGHGADSRQTLQVLVKNELRPGRPLVVKTPDFPEGAEQVAEKLLETAAAMIPISYSFQQTVSVSYNSARMIFQIELCR